MIPRFLDGTRVAQLACDNELSDKACYRYLHEGTDLLVAHALGLRHVLAQAKQAGVTHVYLDGW
ncbi:hypothetical protein [Streptomyces sp. NBC_00878]|uniref:hypothetical protein n=1 Tax=Streptomyces sp. NBC_00878 TaxID=2975854 RepID=UPI002257F4EB|nr:hypothetical protein [Streptomyces sp. NBC_00878]MCX4903469.1 hypothetical protein [Streptomyces sp. NBC_00878]